MQCIKKLPPEVIYFYFFYFLPRKKNLIHMNKKILQKNKKLIWFPQRGSNTVTLGFKKQCLKCLKSFLIKHMTNVVMLVPILLKCGFLHDHRHFARDKHKSHSTPETMTSPSLRQCVRCKNTGLSRLIKTIACIAIKTANYENFLPYL